jgi:hypothetical protein
MKQLTFVFAAIWIAATVWFISMRIEFNQKCLGFLNQAADANTVELAMERLGRAVHYIEKNDWTEGYTSILWNTEDENIGFWYANLKASQQELANALGSSQLEQTNVLMKLRETLTDDTKDGTKITYPDGLWKYPHNALFAVLAWIVNILGFLAVCFAIVLLERY